MPEQPSLTPGPGPQLLFFSGGSALKATAGELCRLLPRTVHLLTPFDSGGSSATLRRAFAMPAVGDLRSRIMALADARRHGNPEIYTLFAYRLPLKEKESRLKAEFATLTSGKHPLMRQIPEPVKGILRDHLYWFAGRMPDSFSLAGANIGNLVLAAGYLRNKRRLGPVMALFSRLVRARGLVRPIVDLNAHLAVRLASGEVITGQHRFTGKERGPVPAPIEAVWLTASEDSAEVLENVAISARTADLIRRARALCYPVGSFYSSLVANLLPSGVGRAVAANRGPKIFVPNLGRDPELTGHTLLMQIGRLLAPLLADAPGFAPTAFLTHVLVDPERGLYAGGIPAAELKAMGVEVLHAPLVPADKGPLADARLLAKALLELVGGDGHDGGGHLLADGHDR